MIRPSSGKLRNCGYTRTLVILPLSIFFSFVQASCMKQNISSAVGGGGGFPPQSGITYIRFSPGNIDENMRPTIDLYGIYRFEKKDIVPSTALGFLFEMLEIEDKVFPMFGSTLNLVYLYDKEKRRWDVSTEFLLLISVERVLTDRFSLFYEFSANFLRSGYIFPKFSFLVGGKFYIKRWRW